MSGRFGSCSAISLVARTVLPDFLGKSKTDNSMTMPPAMRFRIRSPGILDGIVSDAEQFVSDAEQFVSKVTEDVVYFASAAVSDVTSHCPQGPHGCRPCYEGNDYCSSSEHPTSPTLHRTTTRQPHMTDPPTPMSSVNHAPSFSTPYARPTSSTSSRSSSTSMSDGNNAAPPPNYNYSSSQWLSVTLPPGSSSLVPTMRMAGSTPSSYTSSTYTADHPTSKEGEPRSGGSYHAWPAESSKISTSSTSTSSSTLVAATPMPSSSSSSSSRLSAGAIAGMVIAVLAVLILLGAGALWCRRRRRRVSWAMIADPYADKHSVAETHYSFLSAWSVRSGGATSRSVTPTSITSITSLLAPTPPPSEKRTREADRESSASYPSMTSPTSPSSPTPFISRSSHSSSDDRYESESEPDTPVQHASDQEYSYGGGRLDVPLDVSSQVSLLSTSRGVAVEKSPREAEEALSVSTSLFPSGTSSSTLSPGA